MTVVEGCFKPKSLLWRWSLSCNATHSPTHLITEVFCLVATATYVVYMPTSMVSTASTLPSLPGVHNALCY